MIAITAAQRCSPRQAKPVVRFMKGLYKFLLPPPYNAGQDLLLRAAAIKKKHTTMHKNAHFMIAHNHKSPDKLNMQATRHEICIYYAR